MYCGYLILLVYMYYANLVSLGIHGYVTLYDEHVMFLVISCDAVLDLLLLLAAAARCCCCSLLLPFAAAAAAELLAECEARAE